MILFVMLGVFMLVTFYLSRSILTVAVKMRHQSFVQSGNQEAKQSDKEKGVIDGLKKVESSSVTKPLRNADRRFLTWRNVACYVLVILINSPPVLIANVVYVMIESQYSGVARVGIQVAIAVFKLFWNERLLPSLIDYCKYICSATTTAHEDLLLEIIVSILNNITLPCIAIATASSSCFRSAIVKPKTVKSTFTYQYCSIRQSSGECVKGFLYETEKTTSYDPPFQYSFQCSSVLIVSYASVYVLMFLGSAVIVWTVYLPLKALQNRYNKDSYIFKLIDRILPRLLRYLPDVPKKKDAKNNPNDGREITDETARIWQIPALFERHRFVVAVVNKITILLTFGVIFPPLAAISCFGLYRDTVFTQISIGRMVLHARDRQFNDVIYAIDRDCHGVLRAFRSSIWLMGPIALSFYSLFIFDTLGDDIGFPKALWVLFVMPGLPLMYRFATDLRKWYLASEEVVIGIDEVGNAGNAETEMSDYTIHYINPLSKQSSMNNGSQTGTVTVDALSNITSSDDLSQNQDIMIIVKETTESSIKILFNIDMKS
jgi:hypothetical protein